MSESEKSEQKDRNPDGTFAPGNQCSALSPEFKSFRALVNWEIEKAFDKKIRPRLGEIMETAIRKEDAKLIQFFIEKVSGKLESVVDLKNSDGSLTENKKLDLLKLTPEEREQLRAINAKLENLHK